jgi:hypothetical protein
LLERGSVTWFWFEGVRIGALWDNAIDDGVRATRNVGNDAGNRRNRCSDIQRTLNYIAQLASDCGFVAV